jgi:hypothetical protein
MAVLVLFHVVPHSENIDRCGESVKATSASWGVGLTWGYDQGC